MYLFLSHAFDISLRGRWWPFIYISFIRGMIYPAWFIRNRYFVDTSFSRNINISLLLKYIRSYKRVFYRCRYPPAATKIDRFGLDGSETTGGGVQEKPELFDELDVATSNKSVGAKKRPTDSNAVMTPSSSRGNRADRGRIFGLIFVSLAVSLLYVQ